MGGPGRTAEIVFTVELGADSVPVGIRWEASEGEGEGPRECDGLLVSLWDRGDDQTVGLDLWTPRFTVAEMHHHLVQTLVKLADTYERATRDVAAAGRLRTLAGELAKAPPPAK